MSRLFVYGCSFSYPFQDLEHLPPISIEEGWPFKLAKKLNLPLINRATPGCGWNHISTFLQNDFLEGKIKRGDKIILSPSFFERLTFPELDMNKIDLPKIKEVGPWVALGGMYAKEFDEVKSICIKRFCFTLRTFSQLGYDIKGWCWSPTENMGKSTNPYISQIQNLLIPAPDGDLFWQEWILKNPKCMLIPGKKLLDGGWTGDTHFSTHGHKIASEHFFTHLSNIY